MTSRFERLSRIGSGGMGTVWKARDLHTGQVVALKLMHEHLAEDEYLLQRFEHEVELNRRAMASVASPNLVQVLGYGREDGRPYIAMELVEGPSLRAVLKERGALPWHEAKGYLRGVATALQAARAAGVIHRDVKPSNILITNNGIAKLADFGIAKASDMTGLTGSNTALGTIQYMPPDRSSDFRADFYSLGVMLFEMVTGHVPFDGTPGEIIAQHASAEPDLAAISEPQARRLVAWLMQKKPSRRPTDAAQILAALDGTTRPAEFRYTGERPRHEPRWSSADIPVVFAAAALVVGAGMAMLAFRGDDRPPRTSDPSPMTNLSGLSTDANRPPTEPPTQPRAAPSPTPTSYVVRSGDTCSSIAAAMGVAVADLMLSMGLGPSGCAQLNVGYVPTRPSASRCSGLEIVPSIGSFKTDCAVQAGEAVTIAGWGTWCIGIQADTEPVCFSPDGTRPEPWETDLVLQSAQMAALMAKVGDGPWIEVGGGRTFRANAAGALYLAMNDRVAYYGDNYGAIEVAYAVGSSRP